jgi:uncharacterized YccA/Bax inhibitor family protein
MFVQRSGNPTLNAFQAPNYADLSDAPVTTGSAAAARGAAGVMTLSGTVVKTASLVAVCAITAVLVWQSMLGGVFGVSLPPMPTLLVGALGGLVLALVITFVPKLAPVLATPYAVLEGAAMSAFSLFIAERWLGGADNPAATGTIFQAVVLTFTIAAGMLVAYWSGLLKGGKVFRGVLMTGLFGLLLYGATLFIGNFVFGASIPNLYASNSMIGIGFTALCLVLASLFLVLDFRLIENGVKAGAPKHMEWYGAFSLLVTLVWIYIEVLRLLAKLQSRD